MAILEHGREHAARKRGKCEIDLRVIYEDKGVSILMRDNYPPFDPVQWAQIQKPDDPTRCVGIRMVTRMVQTVTYSTTINLNVLMIRLAM